MEPGIWQKIGQVFPIIPVPLIASVVLTLGFAVGDPVHEAFSVYASDFLFDPNGNFSVWERLGPLWRLSAGVVALTFAGFVLWSMSRLALIFADVPNENAAATWIPRTIGAAPLFGAATGMVSSAFSSETTDNDKAVLFVGAQFCSVLGYYIFTRFINRTSNSTKGDSSLSFLLLLAFAYAGIGYAFHYLEASEMRLRVLGVALWSAVTCGVVALILLHWKVSDLRDGLVGTLISWLGGCAMLLGTFGAAFLIFLPETAVWALSMKLIEAAAPWVPIIAFVVTAATAACSKSSRNESGNTSDKSGRSRFAKWHLASVFAIAALGTTMLIWKVDIASLVLGPLALVAMLACLISIIAGYAGIAARKYLYGFPLTGAVILVTYGMTSIGLSDKTWVRTAPTISNDKLSVAEAFTAWDAEGSSDPVYIVAAQGGGLFAGYHVAYALAAITEDHPEISHQIFAISGVSGGSVGAGIYAALQHQAEMENATQLESRRATMRNVLRRDFLSPVLGGLASYDLSLTLLQLPIPHGDRARGLEAGFEAAVERGIGHHGLDFLRSSVFDTWRPNSAVPALFLNTTEVDTGARIVFSPIISAQDKSNSTRSIRSITDGPVPPLSTAMGLSARFPLVTAPGRLGLSLGEKTGEIRLADGGYFDNTGLETATDIIDAIKGTGTTRQIKLIIFRSSSEPFEIGTLPKAEYGNLGAPLTAFIQAWRSRAALTLDATTGRTQGLINMDPGTSVFEFQLNDKEYYFTLSWVLSTRTFCQIERDVELDLIRFESKFTTPSASNIRLEPSAC